LGIRLFKGTGGVVVAFANMPYIAGTFQPNGMEILQPRHHENYISSESRHPTAVCGEFRAISFWKVHPYYLLWNELIS